MILSFIKFVFAVLTGVYAFFLNKDFHTLGTIFIILYIISECFKILKLHVFDYWVINIVIGGIIGGLIVKIPIYSSIILVLCMYTYFIACHTIAKSVLCGINIFVLHCGGKVLLSRSKICDMIINLGDAKQNLSEEQFHAIKSIYDRCKKDHKVHFINYYDYLSISASIIKEFNKIAPYDKYSGGNPQFTYIMMRAIED